MVHAVTDEQYAALLKCEQQTVQLVKENEQLLNEKNSANERFKMLSDLIGVKVAKNDEEESAPADAANAANAANANVAEVRFVWRNGGSKVFVVGSWDDFKFLYPLRTSLSGDSFVATLQLQRGRTYKYKYSVNGEWKLNDKGKTDGQFNICELSALANPMPVQSLQNSQQTENELTNKNMTSENPMVFRKNVAQNNLKNSGDADGSCQDEEYEIEKVLARRLFKTRQTGGYEWKYRIKWAGYDKHTWEPLSHIEHVGIVKEFIDKVSAKERKKKRKKQKKQKSRKSRKTKAINNGSFKKKRGRPEKRHASPANGNNFSSLVDSNSEEISSSNKGIENKRGKEMSTRQANKGVKAGLEIALNLKTGEKVKCKKCGIELKFFGTSSLASHINSVHLKLPLFECPHCEKVFHHASISNPQNHIRKVHSQHSMEDFIDNRSTHFPRLADPGLLEEYFRCDDEQ